MFIDCYHWDKGNALQIHRKLSNEHFFPSTQSKMRNHLADEVLNSDMLNLMIQYQTHLGSKGVVLNGAIELLWYTSKLVSFFRDMRPVKQMNDTRLHDLLSVANFFDDWKTASLNKSSLKSVERSKQIMSIQCHEDIQSCILGMIELCKVYLGMKFLVYITPGLINSDVVENTFNQQRSTYHGANSNPNAMQYRKALNSIVLGHGIISQKANAGKNRATAIPYNLALRKGTSNISMKQHPMKKAK